MFQELFWALKIKPYTCFLGIALGKGEKNRDNRQIKTKIISEGIISAVKKNEAD